MITKFQTIQFSPVPEHVEFVNVALLLHDGPRIIFDPRFPKANCLRSGINKTLLGEYIAYWQLRVRDMSPEAFKHEVVSRSSQFALGRENSVHGTLDEKIEQRLVAKFLAHGETTDRNDRYDRYITTRINDYISKVIGAHDRGTVLKQASPKKFLSSATYRCLGSNGFKVSRVINGLDALLLLDGIILSHKYDPRKAQERATHISYNFFRINKVKADIQRLEHRDVHSAALIFADASHVNEPHAEFALDVLKKNADLVQFASEPAGALANIAAKACATPFTF